MDTMRYRTTFLLLFAMLLALAPLIQTNRAEARCAIQNGDTSDDGFLSRFGFSTAAGPDPCADVAAATPSWARGLGFLSALCFAGCLFSGFVAWRERKREQKMLRDAGIPITEGEMPYDD